MKRKKNRMDYHLPIPPPQFTSPIPTPPPGSLPTYNRPPIPKSEKLILRTTTTLLSQKKTPTHPPVKKSLEHQFKTDFFFQ